MNIHQDSRNFLYSQKVDLFHATTPFLEPVILDFDVCPYVATLYDLIPLIYPKEYLDNPLLAQKYKMALHFVKTSQRLVSISESARQDAYHYLGYRSEYNCVAYPVADPCFRVLPGIEKTGMLESLKTKLNLPAQFILCVTGVHHSKNANTLLKAFRQLPESLQRQMPLVLVFPMPSFQRVFTEHFGIQPNVIYTNSISEEELVALYNSATIVVHPSRYEGFGYPVAEAMKCGAPVITTTTSSLPEIGGDVAILVNPENTGEFVDAIQTLYDDVEKRG